MQKIIDLGEYWETQTQLPIPLGGICWKPGSKITLDKSLFIEDLNFYKVWDENFIHV